MAGVALAVTDGVPAFELAIGYEVFGHDRSDLVDDWYDFRVCAAAGSRVGGWLHAESPYGLGDLVGADTVVVPACANVEVDPPTELVEAVRSAHEAGARVVSICTGAFVLAAAGLLDGRRATTHWLYAGLLARRYPRIDVDADVLYVDDGDILTSAGGAAGIDLCLHVIQNDHGAAAANAIARRLVVPPHRAGGQAQFVPAPLARCDDQSVSDVLGWASARLDQPISVVDLSRHANVSPRTLTRRFRAATGSTPLQWLLAQRIARARELLELTDDGVELVARAVGMGTATTLRRHFTRSVGVPPDTYRRTFGGNRRASQV